MSGMELVVGIFHWMSKYSMFMVLCFTMEFLKSQYPMQSQTGNGTTNGTTNGQ